MLFVLVSFSGCLADDDTRYLRRYAMDIHQKYLNWAEQYGSKIQHAMAENVNPVVAISLLWSVFSRCLSMLKIQFFSLSRSLSVFLSFPRSQKQCSRFSHINNNISLLGLDFKFDSQLLFRWLCPWPNEFCIRMLQSITAHSAFRMFFCLFVSS